MLDIIRKRRSVRQYTSQPVTDEQVEALLEAAMAAPTANNRQPWHFVVVRDAESRRRLGQVHPWAGMCADAPVVFAICAEKDSDHWIEDASAATENLMIEAVAQGLGSVWIGIRGSVNEDKVRSILSIPAAIGVLCLVPVGYPGEDKEPRTQYDAKKVHAERF
jgi:nitroreductase